MIGQSVRRLEDPRFLTGRGQYVDDLPIEGALHATFVRSLWAHARIRQVDKSAAMSRPSVQVFTAADTDLGVSPAPPFIPIDPQMFRPMLATDKVRFAGDIVAVVLASTQAASVDAAELVEVDYEPLPHVVDAVKARDGEVLLFEEVGLRSRRPARR
jgi:carbon-monoxide dehydrogenase large subunit